MRCRECCAVIANDGRCGCTCKLLAAPDPAGWIEPDRRLHFVGDPGDGQAVDRRKELLDRIPEAGWLPTASSRNAMVCDGMLARTVHRRRWVDVLVIIGLYLVLIVGILFPWIVGCWWLTELIF